MNQEALWEAVERLRASLTPEMVARGMDLLLRQEGEELGGGINAMRLVRYLLGEPELADAEMVSAYDRVKDVLEVSLEQVPWLYYFSGD